jgi:hypothetical protein
MAVVKSIIIKNGKRYKRCGRCALVKPAKAFTSNDKFSHGLAVYCRQCFSEYNKRYTDRRRGYTWLKRYGVTPEEYQRLYDLQSGLCAICGNPETRYHRGSLMVLSVDHRHNDGSIRGLLCRPCNVGLGQFRDDPVLVQKALDYLKR